MEFKTCPSCKASVLEDDAEDCPFCGASMSGPPTAPKQSAGAASEKPKPQPKPAAPPTRQDSGKPAPKQKPKADAKRRRAPVPKDDADADPFEIDTRAVQKAAPVSRKPAKGRMHRIICPMCETPGFVALAQVGKEVKCCNPKCLVPIFTVPGPEKPKDDEPEPKRGMSGLVFSVVAIVLIGGVGFGLWHFVLRESDNDADDTVTQVTPDRDPVLPENGNGEQIDVEPEDVEPPPPPPVPLAEVRAESLEEIVRNARQRQNNRSKPYGRRLSSESFTQVGQFDEAIAQIEAMRRVEGYEPFYEVEPWVAIAMARLETGDRDGANEMLDAALEKAQFPVSGRPALDAAGALAAALAVVGRLDEARQVAGDNSAPELRGRLSTLWRGAIDSNSFEVHESAARPDLSSMPDPQWATVTRSLMYQGESDAALAWADSAPTVSGRANVRGVWAAEFILRSTAADAPEALARIEELAGRAEPAGRVRVWAAVSHVQRQRGVNEAADASLERARQAVAELSVPEAPRPVPTLAEIYRSDGRPRAGLPDQAEYVSEALACIDLAQLEAAAGQQEAAWGHVQSALRFLRAATPSPVATEALVNETMNESKVASLKRQLARELNVENTFLAFNQYRQQCGILHEQANLRFQVQVEFLRRAVGWGLGSQVWQEIQSQNEVTTLNDQEPYLTTKLPAMIALHAGNTGDTALNESISAAVSPAALRPDSRDRLELIFDAAIDAADLAAAVAALRAYRRQDPYPLYFIALRGVSRLISEGKHEAAFELATQIPYPPAREDSFWLIAAASVRDGRHSEIWRIDGRGQLPATEQVALYRGFLDGLPLAPSEPDSEDVALVEQDTD